MLKENTAVYLYSSCWINGPLAAVAHRCCPKTILKTYFKKATLLCWVTYSFITMNTKQCKQETASLSPHSMAQHRNRDINYTGLYTVIKESHLTVGLFSVSLMLFVRERSFIKKRYKPLGCGCMYNTS